MSASLEGPYWQANSEASRCFLCQSKFTLFNRRHHCRKCGKVVCGECSDQDVKYLPNTFIMNPNNIEMRSSMNSLYKTCDECATEVTMIRRALLSGSSDSIVAPRLNLQNSDDNSTLAGNNIAKYDNPGKSIGSSTPSSDVPPRNHQLDNESDFNLCPVCSTDLLKAYIGSNKKNVSQISNLDFESFKEKHINDCLIAFDFSLDHQRFNSPDQSEQRKQPRNKMLVYNLPPIPMPKYESIPNAEGPSSDRISGHSENPAILSAPQGTVGSIESSSTIPNSSEKQNNDESLDSECVICLEDLRPGDKVGRLECLCVFHYKCIKDWFNKRGYGQCPIHFFHD